MLVIPPEPSPEDIAMAFLAAHGVLAETAPTTGFTLWSPLWRQVRLRLGEEQITAKLASHSADAHDVDLGDVTVQARRSSGLWRLNGHVAPGVAVTDAQVTVFRAYGITFDRIDPLARAGAAEAGANVVEAPMPGLVKLLSAAPGQAVIKGDRLAILEAMKMEHALLAATDGVVVEVLVDEGAQVSAGAALIRLEEA